MCQKTVTVLFGKHSDICHNWLRKLSVTKNGKKTVKNVSNHTQNVSPNQFKCVSSWKSDWERLISHHDVMATPRQASMWAASRLPCQAPLSHWVRVTLYISPPLLRSIRLLCCHYLRSIQGLYTYIASFEIHPRITPLLHQISDHAWCCQILGSQQWGEKRWDVSYLLPISVSHLCFP